MNPTEFEKYVNNYFQQLGYLTVQTASSGDYGVDVFASKGKEKIAVQVKMYGNSSRKVNRQMVMELQGAKIYFDCTKAIIATNGQVLPDAKEVADKLGIEILNISESTPIDSSYSQESNPIPVASNEQDLPKTEGALIDFNHIWEHYIVPLVGETLSRSSGKSNKIISVDGGGVSRITSNGNPGWIKIETFKFAINKLLTSGTVTRDEINQHDASRVSSGVILILSQVPFFELKDRPLSLMYNPDSSHS